MAVPQIIYDEAMKTYTVQGVSGEFGSLDKAKMALKQVLHTAAKKVLFGHNYSMGAKKLGDMVTVMPELVPIVVYTDGSYSKYSKRGGWGWIRDIGGNIEHDHGPLLDTTNQRAEMFAALKALESLIDPLLNSKGGTQHPVEIYSDSQYLVKGMTTWIDGWLWKAKASGTYVWKTVEGKPVKNQEIWQMLRKVDMDLNVKWTWVKGHSGITGNERADELAVQGLKLAEKIKGTVKDGRYNG